MHAASQDDRAGAASHKFRCCVLLRAAARPCRNEHTLHMPAGQPISRACSPVKLAQPLEGGREHVL